MSSLSAPWLQHVSEFWGDLNTDKETITPEMLWLIMKLQVLALNGWKLWNEKDDQRKAEM